MTAYVYILVHKDKPRFKIGKAVDLAARVAQLTFDELDLSRSHALQVADDAAALNLERALHRCFSKWRLAADDIAAQEGSRFTGYTEWFRSDCLEPLMRFAAQNAELFEYQVLTPDEVTVLVKKPARSPVTLVKSQKERRRVKRVITPDDIQGAKDKVHALLPLLLQLLEHCDDAATVEVEPGVRELRGVCAPENTPAVRDLLHELFDASSYSYSLGGFGIFNGVTTQGDDAGGLQFAARHIWPTESPWESAPFAIAGMELAELPIPLAGWGH